MDVVGSKSPGGIGAALCVHPLALRGSDVMLWDTVRSEVAPRAGIVVDDDIAFDRSAPNLNLSLIHI